MNLRLKSFLVLGLSAALVALVLYVFVQELLKSTFQNTEGITERTRITRVMEDLQYEANTLYEINFADWAVWDDSYNFIENQNQAFVDNNLTIEALHGLRLSVVGYYDLNLKLVKEVWMDWEQVSYLPRPEWMTQPFVTNLQKKQKGLVNTPNGLLAFSVAPIRDSLSRKPANGHLLMGRFLHQSTLNAIGERNHLKVSLQSLQQQPEITRQLKTESLVVVPSAKSLTSYALFRDVNNKPIYVLKIVGNRVLSPVLTSTRRSLTLTIVTMMLLTALLPLVLLNRTVLSRMAGLSEAVRDIRLTQDPRARLPENSRDELGMLSHDINHLLASLEGSRVQLQNREQYFRILSETSSDALLLLDEQSRILHIGGSLHHLLPELEVRLGERVPLQVVAEDQPHVQRFWEEVLHSPGHEVQLEARYLTSGEPVWLEIFARNLLHDPVIQGVVVNLRDITERKTHEERVRHMAFHDALTGLYNRHYLWAEGQKWLDEHPQASFFFMDLDRFKQVNDTFGHEAGDVLLRTVVQRMQQAAPETGIWFRLSGDEFGLLLPGVHAREAHLTAQTILKVVQEPVPLSQGIASVGISIGIALVPEHGRDLQTIVRIADHAMYQAKEKRNTFIFQGG
ncbi:sensor domain-containing diguanylate cyclase [Deinococcus misasensis]|uniref:sensor domain-containing diguanylate cyclase n=1 Tax=Deinococcus misasensis TaxID=392413 RepID=UPI000558B359|nr:diguanylate cyclase [Deinococcus misasensis]